MPSSPARSGLHGIFTQVSPRYDAINHVITLGMDSRWRKLAVKTCLKTKPQKLLDIGCGTGDLTIGLALAGKEEILVTGLDYSRPMLAKAREKASKAGVGKRADFVYGDAGRLPFTDSSFDAVCISFAFRNLTWRNPVMKLHLAEVLRVLRPGGRYVIVESSQPRNAFIRACFRLYLRVFVAPVGQMLSGNKAAYRYLAESAAHFYSPAEVREMLLKAGFSKVEYRALFFGAAGIHEATR